MKKRRGSGRTTDLQAISHQIGAIGMDGEAKLAQGGGTVQLS